MKKKYFFKFSLQLVLLFSISSIYCDTLDFDKLMDLTSQDYKKKYSNQKNKDTVDLLKNLYEKSLAVLPSDCPKIPKIIHQIWVGSKPVPPMFKALQKTWQKYHPDWEYKLWTNQEAEEIILINRDLYDKAKDPVEKADLLRYEILLQQGGLYVDGDFECIASLDKLHYICDFYTGIMPNDVRIILNNAIIACSPGHPIIEQIVTKIKQNKNSHHLMRSGVHHFSNACLEGLKTAPGINVAYPVDIFYPLPYRYNNRKTGWRDLVKPESMAIHYWGSNKGKQMHKWESSTGFYGEN